jgi:hypothetical protein
MKVCGVEDEFVHEAGVVGIVNAAGMAVGVDQQEVTAVKDLLAVIGADG